MLAHGFLPSASRAVRYSLAVVAHGDLLDGNKCRSRQHNGHDEAALTVLHLEDAQAEEAYQMPYHRPIGGDASASIRESSRDLRIDCESRDGGL